ncbi:MAG: hypothetical protein L0312_12790 [Acidobacteria bacterium]|nr:hypothetical protein [Acidobacteriota bacterium]
MFFFTDLASDAESMSAGNGGCGMGLSDGTNHCVISWGGDHALATSNVGRVWRTTACISILTNGNPNEAVTATAAFSGTDIVLTWSATPAAAYELGIIALGGADMTNVAVGNDTMPTVAGNKSVTTVGFQGDFLIIIAAQRAPEGTVFNIRFSWGYAVGAASETAMTVIVQDGQTMSANVNAMSTTSSNRTIYGHDPTNGSLELEAEFTQWTSNGFDLNFITAPATAYGFGFLVIKGGAWAVGTQAKPTTAIAQTVTGLSFQPKVLGLGLTKGTASNTQVSPARTCFGAATATTEEVNIQGHHSDAVSTTVEQQASSTKCAGIAAVFADFTSFQSDGWTITWAQAGNAELVGWFAGGDGSQDVPQFDLCPGNQIHWKAR